MPSPPAAPESDAAAGAIDPPLIPASRREQSGWILVVAALLICIGLAARIRQYAVRASFWGDEAFIVMNVRQLSFAQLSGHLKWDQAAPPLFLWSLKGASLAAGNGEYALRSVPLACSLIGVAVFGLLAWRMLPPPAALLALGLFALSRQLIEYAAQVKQYGCDATISALLLLIALGKTDTSPLRRLTASAAFACVAVWFSHPVSIVFGGISIVLTLACLRKDGKTALAALALNALFAASFLLLYSVSIRNQHTTFLYDYWEQAFPDWKRPVLFPLWVARQLFHFLQSPYRWPGPIFALLICAAVGWAVSRRDTIRWMAVAAPIPLAIMAAAVQQYPFMEGRLTLFLMPELFLLVGAGGAWLWQLLPSGARLAWWVLPISLFATGLATTVHHMLRPDYLSHVRPAVAFYRTHRQPGDAVALTGERSGRKPQPPFDGRRLEAVCYLDLIEPRRIDLERAGEVSLGPDASHAYLKISSLNEIRQQRIWVILTFAPGNARAMDSLLAPFRQIAIEQQKFIDPRGGAAFLFVRKSQAK